MFDNVLATYGGYTLRDDILSCTSGGIATALSYHWINGYNGYVVGVRYTSDFKNAEYIITNNVDDLEKFKGSKYIDVIIGNTFEKIKELLDKNEKILFFGLPCFVAALKNFLEIDYSNLLTCELICAGTLDTKIHTQYIDYLEKKFKSKIIDFNVRKKINKWTPTYLMASFANKKTFIKQFGLTEYGVACSKAVNDRCYQCKYKGVNYKGDIQIGDYWRVATKSECYNELGTSSIIVRTEKGHSFILDNPNIKLCSVKFSSIVNGNRLLYPKMKTEYSIDLLNKIKKYGLIKAVRKKRTFLEKIKLLIPFNVKAYIKGLIKHKNHIINKIKNS